MPDIIFLWSSANAEHLAKHGVAPEEAEYIVGHAQPPFPENVGGAKRSVWGQTPRGRFLQVIFVHVFIDDVTVDEYERLEFHERIALDAGEPAARIIHSRDLTEAEKKRLRRRKRGRR